MFGLFGENKKRIPRVNLISSGFDEPNAKALKDYRLLCGFKTVIEEHKLGAYQRTIVDAQMPEGFNCNLQITNAYTSKGEKECSIFIAGYDTNIVLEELNKTFKAISKSSWEVAPKETLLLKTNDVSARHMRLSII